MTLKQNDLKLRREDEGGEKNNNSFEEKDLGALEKEKGLEGLLDEFQGATKLAASILTGSDFSMTSAEDKERAKKLKLMQKKFVSTSPSIIKRPSIFQATNNNSKIFSALSEFHSKRLVFF